VTITLKITLKESIADEVKRFADMLKPYVRMDKIHQIMEDLNVWDEPSYSQVIANFTTSEIHIRTNKYFYLFKIISLKLYYLNLK